MRGILIIGRGDLDDSVCPTLERENLPTTLQADPRSALQAGPEDAPSLLLLNLPLVGMTAMELIRALRTSPARPPVVVLGEDGEAERARLLETGADDYLVKPFSARELLARVRAILRRTAGGSNNVIRFGGMEADLDRRLVKRDGEEVSFTRTEYNLLLFLLSNAGRVVTRQEVLNSVWGYVGCVMTRTADVHVMRLRRKIEGDPAAPRHLETVHGVGYRFRM